MDELLALVCTLDEPVTETIMRDVRAVGAKLKAVLIPLDRNVSCGLNRCAGVRSCIERNERIIWKWGTFLK